MRTGTIRLCGLTVLAVLCWLGPVVAISAADNTTAGEPPPKPEEGTEAQQTLRSYLQLQEQLHSTLLTIERARKEAEAAAKANTDAITLRLEALEQSLGAQRRQEMSLLQNSNRVTLIAAGTFAVLGLLAMIFTAWFLLRAMNRLALMAGGVPAGTALIQGQSAPMVSPDAHLVDLRPVEPSSARLLGVIERLEKRVGELEHTSNPSAAADLATQHNGEKGDPQRGRDSGPAAAKAEVTVSPAPPSDRVAGILGKAQSLLSLDKTEDAIACFDEALALDPRHAEALVKKGTALERLGRLEAAIQCYDRAIAANHSMTLAYLHKGGACNQLERYGEALECYEQALRTQKK